MSTTERATALATIRHEGGLRLSAEVRGHHLLTDQPVAVGGSNSALTPLELIGAALGTCIGLAIVQFCTTRELPTAGLRIDISQHTTKGPYRVDRYTAAVTLPRGFPSAYHEVIERLARSCAAYNTLTHRPDIEVDVQPLPD